MKGLNKMKQALTLFALLASLSIHASITIGAYNIRNFDYDERYRIRTDKPQLSEMLKNLKVDVLSVEEVVNKAEFELFITTNLPGYKVAISECGGAHGQHLGFIYNSASVDMLSFNEDLSISEPGQAGGCNSGSRPLGIGLFQIKSNKQKFYGMTAHLKSGSDPESVKKRSKQFEIIKKIVKELKAKTGVQDFYIAGDMNTTEYISRGIDYKLFTKLVSDLGMYDLAQDLACSAYWWGGTDDGIEEPSLLDHVIITPGLRKTSNKAESQAHCKKVSCRKASLAELGVSYESVSDHCPITATIQ
jgi:endonuclease/exonuclease/phosphatase family metal-dependent hydrolase